MRRPLSIILWLQLTSCVTAQLSITDSTRIVGGGLGILYRGISNPLWLTACSNQDNLILLSNECELTKVGREWSALPLYRDQIATVECYAISGEDSLLVYTRSFKVFDLPMPYPYVGGRTYYDRTISLKYLMNSTGLALKFNNFSLEDIPQVKSFEITAISGTDTVSAINQGARFSDAANDLFKKLQVGDLITFHSISAQCGTALMKVEPLALYCTED